MSELTQYIGSQGAAFERVCLAFEALGYQPPHPDRGDEKGAYAINIVGQYHGNLSEREALAIVRLGLNESRGFLEAIRGQWTLDDVLRVSV